MPKSSGGGGSGGRTAGGGSSISALQAEQKKIDADMNMRISEKIQKSADIDKQIAAQLRANRGATPAGWKKNKEGFFVQQGSMYASIKPSVNGWVSNTGVRGAGPMVGANERAHATKVAAIRAGNKWVREGK